jgi:gluconolactonase
MNKFIHAGVVCVAILVVAPLCLAREARAADASVVVGDLHDPREMIFVGKTLYFTDFETSSVLRLVGTRLETIWHEQGCGASGLVQVSDALLVACFNAGSIVKLSLDGAHLKTITRDEKTELIVAPNDLVTDSNGGVYLTTSSANGAVRGKIYYLDTDDLVHPVADGIDFANGVVVSPDGTRLFVAETRRGRLLTYKIVNYGKLGPSRELVTLVDILSNNHGTYSPDGLQLDDHGNLFVGLYNGGGFAVLTAAGRLIREVHLPSAHHANLAITPDGKSIYVTSVEDQSDGTHRGEIIRLPNPIP